jgi:hypothetical protein
VVSPKGVRIVKSDEVTLMCGRNKLLAVWRPGERWFEVSGVSLEDVNAKIVEIELGIEGVLDRSGQSFLNENHLIASAPVWCRKEFALKGDDFLDKLPRELVIHDSVFKKVYANTSEFISFKQADGDAGAYAKMYIKNRALEDIAPEIARELAKPALVRAKDYLCVNGFTQANLITAGHMIDRSLRPTLYEYFIQNIEEMNYDR